MKKFFSTMAVAALLLAGVTSCAKDGGAVTEEGTGNLTVNFGFPESRAVTIPTSGAEPTTSWAQNVQRLMVLFVNGTTVADARDMAIPTVAGHAQATETFTGVIANPAYTVYIVANYPNTGAGAWTSDNVKGDNIATMLLQAADANAAYGGTALGAAAPATGYGETPEFFVASQTNIAITEGVTTVHSTPFNLTRVVSQMRIRIDQDGDAGLNSNVDFTGSGSAQFFVRRVAPTYALNNVLTAGSNSTVLFSAKDMKTVNPTAATYSNPTTIMDGAIVDFWNDYLIFPGGGNTTTAGLTEPERAAQAAKRFDIVLSGLAPANYIPFDNGGVAVPAGTRLYWTGQIDHTIGANDILEVNLVLNRAGGITPPPVGAYGNLEINVDLIEWGTVFHVNQEL